ncbi:MAG: MotA/TolQ/ExbB proton channel family protein [Sphingopyxis sp.]|nr:MotA/TolQ/ExbB proton channel family protein [Sphingopyxis sp.]
MAGSERLSVLLELGGPVVRLLLVLSIAALAIVLFKIVQFARYGLLWRSSAQTLADSWIASGAARMPTVDLRHQTPSEKIVASAIRASIQLQNIRVRSDLSARTSLWDARKASVEDELGVQSAELTLRLQSGFRALDLIAQLAPLIGLFGTVIGMIEAFRAMQDAGASVDPSVLAGGIWVALLTTAVGLGVAMPTSAALAFLESRVAGELIALDSAVVRVLAIVGHQMRNGTEGVNSYQPAGQALDDNDVETRIARHAVATA